MLGGALLAPVGLQFLPKEVEAQLSELAVDTPELALEGDRIFQLSEMCVLSASLGSRSDHIEIGRGGSRERLMDIAGITSWALTFDIQYDPEYAKHTELLDAFSTGDYVTIICGREVGVQFGTMSLGGVFAGFEVNAPTDAYDQLIASVDFEVDKVINRPEECPVLPS